MDKLRVVLLVGIDDTNKVAVRFLSPDPEKIRLEYEGNLDVLPLLEMDQVQLFGLVCGGMAGDTLDVPPSDVIFNAICNPDTNKKSLAVATRIIDQLGLPVVNHPDVVARTARDDVAARLDSTLGLRTPTTVRARPAHLSDVAAMIDCDAIRLPFLVREVGSHSGINLTLVGDEAGLRDLDKFAFDGREFYVTEYVDFRSQDGLYRKYRTLVIEGLPYPKHMVAAPTWNVHWDSRAAFMAKKPALLQEEEAWLAEFDPKSSPLFSTMASELGLDFFGVDYGVGKGGDLVLFEANSCFKVLAGTATEDTAPYQQEATRRIRQALGDLLRHRAAAR